MRPPCKPTGSKAWPMPAEVDGAAIGSVICRQGNGFGRDHLRPGTDQTETFNMRVRKTP